MPEVVGGEWRCCSWWGARIGIRGFLDAGVLWAQSENQILVEEISVLVYNV